MYNRLSLIIHSQHGVLSFIDIRRWRMSSLCS
jgi:hypothetical protein